MIKANELRIGNIVEWDDDEMEGNKTVMVESHNIGMSEFFNPIPLSEEILLKVGFERKSKKTSKVSLYSYKENPCNFDFYFHLKQAKGNEWWFFINIGYGFRYLHEVQNAVFALTKEELEVNL